jgi:error-prone DNA polymerase
MRAHYAELAVTSNFSFLRGASHPEELVTMAAALGLQAIGIADRNTLAGVVRAHVAAKQAGIQLLVGARLITNDGFETICYPIDRAAYGRLCRLLTRGNRRAKKGECHLTLADIIEKSDGQIFVVLTPQDRLSQLAKAAPGRVYLSATWLYACDNQKHIAERAELSREVGTPLVAINDVHYHIRERQILQDVLTCIREKTNMAEAGLRLAANAERFLKPPEEMVRLFSRTPEAIAHSLEIAKRVKFSLDELKYSYPTDCIGDDPNPQAALTRLTWEGAATRYPNGIPGKIKKQLEYELKLISELNYAPYFLTVWDIVQYARQNNILCQGRGSAANSAVCYVLGITAVDPARLNLLFERFISSERDEPPDIDVDFEHEKREEIIQYIYKKYGRERASLAATVITYRSKSAIREVGKALGLSLDVVGALSKNLWGWGKESFCEDHLAEIGLDPADPTLALAIQLAREIHGFPRHLSQHVGGFVITNTKLEEMIPIGNAAMDDRTFVEWDKSDLEALGILKIDVLALGMLTCIAKCFALIEDHYGRKLTIDSVPPEDPEIYDMLCLGDSVGVFQVESRAQMSMLPRLKPRVFNDLVIEVAIVRPGPIQGDMVHPYLRRREGSETVSYPTKELEDVLELTLGVPLFQEQAMQIAIAAAGFTPAEADKLRRAMATFRRSGTIPQFREKFIAGMLANHYEQEFAERCFRQIEGFADYGFPMSHAASFALLVYVSSWLKHHYPEVFCAGLLNAQPMGFYQPAQLVSDARNHDVIVLAPDINKSEWDNILEKAEPRGGRCALRLGFRQIDGFRPEDAENLIAARGRGFEGVHHLKRASGLSGAALSRLAHADAFRSLGLDRRQGLWAVKGLDGGKETSRALVPELPLFTKADPELLHQEADVQLPEMQLGEHIVHDYATLRLSLKSHPLALLRKRLTRHGAIPNAKLAEKNDGARVTVCGLVLVRQRPGTAKEVIFVTLEDETGIANAIIWPSVFEKFRRALLGSRLLSIQGKLQRQGLVMHVIAERLEDLSDELDILLLDEKTPDPKKMPDSANIPGAYAKTRKRRGTQIAPRSRNFH